MCASWDAKHVCTTRSVRRSLFAKCCQRRPPLLLRRMTLARALLASALLLHSTMALRLASNVTAAKPWGEALEEARGILAKDCGAECLRILDTVVTPALNGTQSKQVFL